MNAEVPEHSSEDEGREESDSKGAGPGIRQAQVRQEYSRFIYSSLGAQAALELAEIGTISEETSTEV